MPKGAKNQQSKAVISAIAAQLFVSDITVSCEFFIQKLGFSIVSVCGEPPFYAQAKETKARSISNASTTRSSILS